MSEKVAAAIANAHAKWATRFMPGEAASVTVSLGRGDLARLLEAHELSPDGDGGTNCTCGAWMFYGAGHLADAILAHLTAESDRPPTDMDRQAAASGERSDR